MKTIRVPYCKEIRYLLDCVEETVQFRVIDSQTDIDIDMDYFCAFTIYILIKDRYLQNK